VKEGATLTRRSQSFSLPKLERCASQPLRLHIYRQLRQAIWRRELPPGSVLPSSRALAKQLGVSRNTVLDAYEALAAEGLIGARRGSGTRVLGRAATPKRRGDLTWILRDSHYPANAVAFPDPDGNSLYAHS